MGKFGTSFLETEALLAASEEDYAALTEILDGMLPTEVTALWRAADRLRMAALDAMRAQSTPETIHRARAVTAPAGA